MLKSIGSSWMRNIVTAAVLFITNPFLLGLFGESLDIWKLTQSYIGLLLLLALGIPAASVRTFSQAVAREDKDELNRGIGSAALLYALVGAAALVVGLVQYFIYDATFVAGEVALKWPDQVADARLTFVVMIGFTALSFIAQLPGGVMVAHNHFGAPNLINIGGLLLRLIVILGVLPFHPSLGLLAVLTVVILLMEFATGVIVMHRRYPGTRIRLRDANLSVLKKITAFSVFVLLLNMGIKLAFAVDGIVLSGAYIAGDITKYEAANSLMVYLIEFIITIGAVAMPLVTQLQTKGELSGLRELYMKWSKVAFSLTLVAGLYLIVLGPAFLGTWMAPDFEDDAGPVLQVLMLSALIFMPVRGVSLGFLMGLGKVRAPALLFLVTGLINLGISIALVKPMGMMGVALGTAVPNVLFAAAVVWLMCRELELGIGEFARYVLGRAVVGCVPVLLFLYAVEILLDPFGFPLLIGLGIVHTAIFAVVWVFFVYAKDPHLDLLQRLKEKLGRAG